MLAEASESDGPAEAKGRALIFVEPCSVAIQVVWIVVGCVQEQIYQDKDAAFLLTLASVFQDHSFLFSDCGPKFIV